MTSAESSRIPVLDATRGVLASVVLGCHTLLAAGIQPPPPIGTIAVEGFFVMSGLVLVRGYGRRWGAFLVRRFVRLWPLFALCLAAGAVILHARVTLGELIWLPGDAPGPNMAGFAADRPAWSLVIEWWVMAAIPLIAWCSRNPLGGALVALVAVTLGGVFWWAAFFIFGAMLAHREWPAWQPPAPLMWLGKVSFSLYLSHWIVLGALGPWGALLALPVAWVVWLTVEQPSVRASRMVGKLLPRIAAKAQAA